MNTSLKTIRHQKTLKFVQSYTKIAFILALIIFSISPVAAQTTVEQTMSWKPQGTQIAVGDSNGQISIFNTQTNEPVTSFQAHTGDVFKLAYSPDGTRLASVSSAGDSLIKIWNSTTGQLVLSIQVATTAYPLLSLAWSPDGSKIAAGGLGSAGVWNSTTGQPLNSLPDPSVRIREVFSLVWSPDGSRIATATTEGIIRIWSLDTSHEILSISNSNNAGDHALAWSPDGQKISGDGYDNQIRIWDASSGHLLTTLTGHTEGITSTKWNADSIRLLSSGLDGTVRIWDTVTGQLIQTFSSSGQIYDAAWNPNGSQVAFITNGSNVVSINSVPLPTPSVYHSSL